MSTSNLADRLLLLIKMSTQEHRRYKELEEKTGIAADRWKAFALGRQRPTSEMIEAVGKMKPECCQWLLTGTIKVMDVPQLDPTDKESEERALTSYANTLLELATGLRPELTPYLARARPEFWKGLENDPEIALLRAIQKQGHATDEQLAALQTIEEKKKANDNQAG